MAKSPGFVQHPDHEVDLKPSAKQVRVIFNGQTVADTSDALLVRETGHDPVFYLPEKDVRMDLLTPTDHHTHCPFKGDASYWTLTVGDRSIPNGVWSYTTPYDEMADLVGHYAFYADKVDRIEAHSR